MNKQLMIDGKMKRALYLTTAFYCIFMFILIGGCSKEKATEPKGVGPAGTCEILDALPKDVLKPFEINYANRIKLIGVTVNNKAPDKLQVSYYWQPIDELDPFNMVFVHFTYKDNKVVFQNDHPFCQKQNLKELQNKILKETHVIDFPATAKGKEIYLKIGFYNPKASGRLKIISSGGVKMDDDNTRAIVESLKL
jgi:hypothetical protein